MAEWSITAVESPLAGTVRWLRGLAGAAAVLLVAGCGGGQGGEQAPAAGTSRALAAGASVSAADGSSPLPASLTVTSLTKVRETRIGRTLYEYEFQVNLNNAGGETGGAVVRLTAAPAGTQVLDGTVAFATVPAGAFKSATDTITLRQDRSQAFSLSALTWDFSLATAAPAQRVQVTFAPGVSSAITSRVTELRSRIAASTSVAPLLVERSSTGIAPTVIALDKDGNILLAGVAGAQAVELGSASTAMEMVRAATPLVPGHEGFPAFDDHVRSKAAYVPLVNAVAQAHEAGKAPHSVAAVVAALDALVDQVLTPPAEVKATSTPLPRTARALAIPADRPLDGPPITLTSLFDGRKVVLHDRPFRASSTHPLAWALQSKNWSDVVLKNASGETEALLAPYLIDSQLNVLWKIAGGHPAETAFPAEDDGRSIGLTLKQTSASVTYNVSVIVGGLARLALDLKGTNACLASAGGLLLGDLDGIGQIMAAPSKSAISDYLWGRLKAGLAKDIGTLIAVRLTDKDILLKDCVKSVNSVNDLFLANLAFAVPWLKATLEAYEAVDRAVAGYQYASMLTMLTETLVEQYSQQSAGKPVGRSIGVCFKAFDSIGNCASTLRLTPDNLLMSPGASYDGPKVSARDLNGSPTVVPHLTLELNVKQATSSIVEAMRTPEGVKVTASGVGDADVSLTDSATGATTSPGLGLLRVSVRAPRFASSTVDVKVGESVDLPLVDASGRRLDFNGPTSYLASSNAIVEIGAQFNGVNEASPTRATSLRVKGLKAGEAIVWATNLATGLTFQTSVRVIGGCLETQIGALTEISSLIASRFSGRALPYPSNLTAAWDGNCKFLDSSLNLFDLRGEGSVLDLRTRGSIPGVDRLLSGISVSADGSRALFSCYSPELSLCVIDLAPLRLVFTRPAARFAGLGGVNQLSRDGKRLLYLLEEIPPLGGLIKYKTLVINVDSGQEVCVTCSAETQASVRGFSEDGQTVLVTRLLTDPFASIRRTLVSFVDVSSGLSTDFTIESAGTLLFEMSGNGQRAVGVRRARDNLTFDGIDILDRQSKGKTYIGPSAGTHFPAPGNGVFDPSTNKFYYVTSNTKKLVELDTTNASFEVLGTLPNSATSPKSFLGDTSSLALFGGELSWLWRIK